MRRVLNAVHVAPLTGRRSRGRPGCPEPCRCDALLCGWRPFLRQDSSRPPARPPAAEDPPLPLGGGLWLGVVNGSGGGCNTEKLRVCGLGAAVGLESRRIVYGKNFDVNDNFFYEKGV